FINILSAAPGKIVIASGFLVAAMIAGCTQANTWSKPGITEVGFHRDMADCRRQASKATQPTPFVETDRLERSDMRDRLIRRCMEGRGYTLTTGE
ncbi:MAG: hypothetical protein AB7E77_09935, partial [Desulfobulbus sp.]